MSSVKTTNDPARCLTCGYVLLGLPEGRCPECGKSFDPDNPATYTTRPLFVRWKYWLPGFVLAAGGGAVLSALLVFFAGWGVAATIAAPFAVGASVGYGCRARPFVLTLLALGALSVVVLTLYTLSFVGIFCGMVFAAVALVPVLVGTGCGVLLRIYLKATNFEQRSYLPLLTLAIATGLLAAVERATFHGYAEESVVTGVDIPVPVGRAWNAVMFYEEVHHRPPLLLRIGLPRPLYTRGSTAAVGDRKVCVYSKGRLVKQVTQRVPERRLAFDVIGQEKIENNSVRLTGGSFDFTCAAPETTHVELTTSYEPKLGPRWIWRPAERLAVHTLHRHVLEGMREKAMEQ
ncbi:MAG TPA: hypothetical protein VG269_21255 [Tepidisphaeraceae bacterium]|jgi:hypothetical protein|nr:hypothetical protein [Tepidisphaeraceae bacterium]